MRRQTEREGELTSASIAKSVCQLQDRESFPENSISSRRLAGSEYCVGVPRVSRGANGAA